MSTVCNMSNVCYVTIIYLNQSCRQPVLLQQVSLKLNIVSLSENIKIAMKSLFKYHMTSQNLILRKNITSAN